MLHLNFGLQEHHKSKEKLKLQLGQLEGVQVMCIALWDGVFLTVCSAQFGHRSSSSAFHCSEYSKTEARCVSDSSRDGCVWPSRPLMCLFCEWSRWTVYEVPSFIVVEVTDACSVWIYE